MKKLALKSYPDGFKDKDMIQVVAESPVDAQRGMNVEEIRKGIRILDALESSSDTLILEDADHSFLSDKITIFRFGKADRRVIDLVDRIASAETVEK